MVKRKYDRHGHNSTRGKTSEYIAWDNVKARCRNPKRADYVWYGARGITICDEWLNSFNAFLAGVGPSPGNGYSLDRIDNDKGYEPGNVRWATKAEQARNRSTTILTEEDVREIRCLCAIGVTHRWLAKLYKVDPTTISDIYRVKSWR